jgi:acyl-CoA synthetase (AMP-forming)/AMP-acid ligase II
MHSSPRFPAPWAVVICDGTVDRLRAEARKRLSSFKVPTVWLLTTSDDDVPRSATGKVDIRRLREMLAERG